MRSSSVRLRALGVRSRAVCGVAFVLLAGCSTFEGKSPLAIAGSGFFNVLGIPVSMGSMQRMLDAGDSASESLRGLSDEQEYYLGRGVSAVILSRYKRSNAPTLSRYLNQVGRLLAVHSSRAETFGGYHFCLLDSDEINAVSAPGGFTFLSSGFLRLLSNEDELAAVLAHEIGHVAKGHGVAAISDATLTRALTAIGREAAVAGGGVLAQGVSESFGDSITEVTNTLLTKGYSRSQEYEADAYAAELLWKTGYNPQALRAVLAKLAAREGRTAEGGASGGWFATHPSSVKREREVAEGAILEAFKLSAEEVKNERARSARFSILVKRRKTGGEA